MTHHMRHRRMTMRSAAMVTGLVTAATLLAGCSNSSEAPAEAKALCEAATENVAAFGAELFSKGPNGETSADASSIDLTDEEVEQVRQLNATAAVVMHFSGDSWSQAQLSGIRQEFDRFGIEIVAETDAEGDPSKQVSDIETVLARDPDVILSIPSLDVVATAPAFKEAASRGIKIVFMENPAQGMQPGADYISVVATDNYGQGVITAHLMAEAVGCEGKIGTMYHAAKAPTNVDRYQGFIDTIEQYYPKMSIVEEEGLLGPDWKGQGETTANGMMVKNQDLAGVWCWFDVPCEGALAAARGLGRDIIVTAVDLGKSVAIDMAQGGMTYGVGAAQPFDQGVVEARLAAYGLLGKEAPPFVALGALPVTSQNLLEQWSVVYHEDPPAEVIKALEQSAE